MAESVMLRRKFASGEDGGGWGGWVHWQRGGCGTEEGQPGGSARQCACCCGNPLLELPSPHVPMLPTITAAARTACAACRGRGRERLPAPQRREAAWAGAGAQHGQGVGGGEGQQGPQSPRTQGEWHERRWLAGWLAGWLAACLAAALAAHPVLCCACTWGACPPASPSHQASCPPRSSCHPPTHPPSPFSWSSQVMVANIRCAEIMEEQLAAFRGDPAWAALAEEAGQDLAAGFGQRAADLMDSCLEGECCAALCCACCAVLAVLCCACRGLVDACGSGRQT